jgi:hypothetical protein
MIQGWMLSQDCAPLSLRGVQNLVEAPVLSRRRHAPVAIQVAKVDADLRVQRPVI